MSEEIAFGKTDETDVTNANEIDIDPQDETADEGENTVFNDSDFSTFDLHSRPHP